MKSLLLASLICSSALAQEVYFSPHGGCTQACVQLIDGAKEPVLVLAYSFTSAPIGDALIRAAKRGVKVQCVVDRSQKTGKKCLVPALRRAKVPIWYDFKHRIAHQKVLVIDGQVVENGSFNYSAEAETSNSENVLVTHNSRVAALYRDNWLLHQSHSVVVP